MEELKLSELREKCLTSLYSCTENVFEYFDNESDTNEGYDNLRSIVKEYSKMKLFEEASKKAIQSMQGESDIEDWDSLKNLYEDKLAQFMKKHSKSDNHYVKELERRIETVEKSRERNLEESMDIVITQTEDPNIDPLTKKRIKIPMRNTICNHLYDKERIEKFLENKKNKGCPHMGCMNRQVMKAQHLKLDEELLAKLHNTQEPSRLSQEY